MTIVRHGEGKRHSRRYPARIRFRVVASIPCCNALVAQEMGPPGDHGAEQASTSASRLGTRDTPKFDPPVLVIELGGCFSECTDSRTLRPAMYRHETVTGALALQSSTEENNRQVRGTALQVMFSLLTEHRYELPSHLCCS